MYKEDYMVKPVRWRHNESGELRETGGASILLPRGPVATSAKSYTDDVDDIRVTLGKFDIYLTAEQARDLYESLKPFGDFFDSLEK